MLRTYLAILVGKLIFFLSRFLKIGGGSTAPGYYGLILDPSLTLKLTKEILKNIIITGTNGKTTTARLLAHFARAHNLKVLRNATGSNLERGVASTLINHSSWTGKIQKIDLAIWEVDEAAFNTVANKINPDLIVFLNVFRDQLDRYGEVDSVVKAWCQTLKTISSPTKVLTNGDDANTSKLAHCFSGEINEFGVRDQKILGEQIATSKVPERLDFEAINIKLQGLKGSTFQLTVNNEPLTINLPLPGLYHIYDFLAAFGLGTFLNIPAQEMVNSLKHYSPAFGRVEKLKIKKRDCYILLIKNPIGASQVLQTIISEVKENDSLILALNDNFADGRDVSWIWDGDFEILSSIPDRLSLITSGSRAQDLALRLKYAGVDPQVVSIENNLTEAFKMAQQNLKGRLFILPTYTALLELQEILAKQGIKKHYWREA